MTPALRILGRAVVTPPRAAPDALKTSVITAVVGAAARAGVRHILAAPDVVVTEVSPVGTDVLAAVRWQPPHVLLLDGAVAHPDALEIISRLAAEAPAVRVLLLLATDSAEVPLRAAEMGAAGHVDARAEAAVLRAAVRDARRGERVLSPVMREALLAGTATSSVPTLTAREFQVLRLIARGDSVDAVAEALAISRSTVHTYRSQIRDKLGLDSDVALARYAQARGLD